MSKLKISLLLFCIVISQNIHSQQAYVWTLEKCIEYAWGKNIQIRKNELSNQRLDLYASQAKAQRFPNANASVSQNFNWAKSSAAGESGLIGPDGSNLSISGSVTVFNGFKIGNQIKQAELDLKSGLYSLETAKENLSMSILNAYLQILYAEEMVRNTEKQIESTSGQLNLAKERLLMQVISQSDFAQVKSQLASEKLTLTNAQSQLAMAKVNLMQLMELPVTDDFQISHPDLSKSLNQNRNPDVNQIFETALSIKPQVKSAEINKEIAALDEMISRAGYYPALSLSASLSSSYSSIGDERYFTQLNNGIRPSAGLVLSIPVYQRKQVKTSVNSARIGYRDSELSETDTKNQLRKSIEQACQDIISAQAEYESSLEKYNATLESSTLSDEKFTQGIINSVDYLVSKTNLIVSESQLLQSKFNLIFSYKILDFYSGIPFSL